MYTKRGDRGETSLYGKSRVSKDSAIVEAYGTIDELNSVLGIVISGTADREISAPLKRVQAYLFVAGADAANPFEAGQRGPRLSQAETTALEAMTDELISRLPALRNFILPGGGRTGAALHLARTVCRRAERRLVLASKKGPLNPEMIPFFNRLSTYLFDLARYSNLREKKKETVWRS